MDLSHISFYFCLRTEGDCLTPTLIIIAELKMSVLNFELCSVYVPITIL